MGPTHYDFDNDLSHRPTKKPKKMNTKNNSRFSNKEKEVLRHRNKTFLTPTVNLIAKDFFVGSLLDTIPNHEEQDDSNSIKLPQYKAHYSDPLKITWGPCFPNQKAFTSANVDGVVYKVGLLLFILSKLYSWS